MMNRKRFLSALGALIGMGIVNPRLFDSYAPATPGVYKILETNDPIIMYGRLYLDGGNDTYINEV